MPVENRIDMQATRASTPVGIKIFGSDLGVIAQLGERLENVLRDVPGTRSVFAERTTAASFSISCPAARPPPATASTWRTC